MNGSSPTPRTIVAGLVLASLAAGCVTANFVATDRRYRSARTTAPRVFVDRLPERPYQSVGIIEVSGPPAQMDLATVMAEAGRAGGDAGCDVVVDRAIHRVSVTSPVIRRQMLAQYTPYPSPTIHPYTPPPATAPAYIPPPSRHEFVCGVYVAAPPPSPPPPAPTPPGA